MKTPGKEAALMDGAENELSERKKLILKAITDAYIRSGEPVGSKYLSEDEQIACSSATIRNEMAELEVLGYLEQPHSSAGRVPSEKGYRFYVDSLMQQYSMTSAEIAQLNKIVGAKHSEADGILESAAKAMSKMTNYTGLTVRTRQSGTTVARFDAMYIDEHTFALIMLTGAGALKTKKVHTELIISETDVTKLASALNGCLVNISPESITLPTMLELEKRLEELGELVGPITRVIYDALKEYEGAELRYEGVDKLLEYPEFADTSKLKHMLQAFDNRSGLLNVVSSALGDDTNIIIGSENPMDEMNDSSMIVKTIRIAGNPVGAIGIIGPRRMDYAKVCAMVKYIADSLEKAMEPGALLPPQAPGGALEDK